MTIYIQIKISVILLFSLYLHSKLVFFQTSVSNKLETLKKRADGIPTANKHM